MKLTNVLIHFFTLFRVVPELSDSFLSGLDTTIIIDWKIKSKKNRKRERQL